jgi:hypothetical protein
MDKFLLSSSPRSVSGYLFSKNELTTAKKERNDNKNIERCQYSDSTPSTFTVLQEFEQRIPSLIQLRKAMMSLDDPFQCYVDPILQFMR